MLPAYLILQYQSLCPEVERMIREMRRHENADALCMKTQHKIEKAVCISSFSMRRRLIENEERRTLCQCRRKQNKLPLYARDMRVELLTEMIDAEEAHVLHIPFHQHIFFRRIK